MLTNSAAELYSGQLPIANMMTNMQNQRHDLIVLAQAMAPRAVEISQVTPSGQRTMRACLGAAAGLQSVHPLASSWLDQCKLLHCEGYVLYRPKLAEDAMVAAKREGALVCSCPFLFHAIHRKYALCSSCFACSCSHSSMWQSAVTNSLLHLSLLLVA